MLKFRQLNTRWKKVLWCLFLEVVATVIICVGLHLYTTILLNREFAYIRQKGEPLTSVEALPKPIPASQNAAPLYQRAAKAMRFKHSTVPDKLDDKQLAAILQQNIQTIRLLREATSKPQCRFPLVRDDSEQWVTTPSLSQMCDLTRLLGIQAYLDAKQGNKTIALQDIRRQFIMARHMAEEPIQLCALVVRSMQNIANHSLAKVLLEIPITATEAHRFEASLPQINWDTYLHQVLLTERILQSEMVKSQRQKFGIASGLGSFLLSQACKMDQVYTLRIWRDVLDEEEQAPIPVPPDYGQAIDRHIEKMPRYALATKTLMPLYTKTRRLLDYAETQHRQRKIALALAVYNSQYHQYPKALSGAETLWKSTFPLDIYTQKPFYYRRDGKSYLLYSVGPNKIDDGGIWKYRSYQVMSKDDLSWKNKFPTRALQD